MLFRPAGVRGTYLVVGLAGLLATAALSTVLPREGRPVSNPHGAASLRGKGRLLASFGLHSATLYVLILLLPKYATELGWTAAEAGRLVAVSAVTAGIAQLGVARLMGRFGPEPLLRALHVLRALALALAALATSPRDLVVAAVIFGMASFTVIPLTMALLTRDLSGARFGRALAPAWVIHQLSAGLALGVAATVHAVSGSYRGYFVLGVLLSLAAAVLAGPVPAAITTRWSHRKETAR